MKSRTPSAFGGWLPRGRRARRPPAGRRRPAKVALIAVLALTLTAGAAQAIRLVAGNVVITGDGGFTPKALPRDHDAPITIRGGGRISTISGAYPPIIKTITIDYDKHGSVQTKGLAVCHASQLTNTTVAAARRACPTRSSGKGIGRGVVIFPDQKPIPASSPITVFNGPKLHGQDTVIGHAYTTIPGPTTFIVPVVIQHIHEGRYGYRTTIRIPQDRQRLRHPPLRPHQGRPPLDLQGRPPLLPQRQLPRRPPPGARQIRLQRRHQAERHVHQNVPDLRG